MERRKCRMNGGKIREEDKEKGWVVQKPQPSRWKQKVKERMGGWEQGCKTMVWNSCLWQRRLRCSNTRGEAAHTHTQTQGIAKGISPLSPRWMHYYFTPCFVTVYHLQLQIRPLILNPRLSAWMRRVWGVHREGRADDRGLLISVGLQVYVCSLEKSSSAVPGAHGQVVSKLKQKIAATCSGHWNVCIGRSGWVTIDGPVFLVIEKFSPL